MKKIISNDFTRVVLVPNILILIIMFFYDWYPFHIINIFLFDTAILMILNNLRKNISLPFSFLNLFKSFRFFLKKIVIIFGMFMLFNYIEIYLNPSANTLSFSYLKQYTIPIIVLFLTNIILLFNKKTKKQKTKYDNEFFSRVVSFVYLVVILQVLYFGYNIEKLFIINMIILLGKIFIDCVVFYNKDNFYKKIIDGKSLLKQ